MSKGRMILIAGTLAAVIGGGVWFVQRADAVDAPPYRFARVQRGSVESTVTSTGKLNALQSVAVGTQVSGRVTELYADYNDRVRKGDLIARIDPVIQEQQVRNAEANLERVRAALVQAERDYERNRTLYERQVITEAEFNQVEYNLVVARANLQSSEVSLEQARQNLAYTEIYAPIDGIVVERNVEPGQTVAASLSAPQLYLLASDLSEMEILATVDEADIGMIRNGMPVRFTVQAYPTDVFEGTVRQVRLSSTTQENVVNYTAVISVENPDGRLLPGMTAEVDFIVERAEDVFLVPNAALRLRPTEEMIAGLADPEMRALFEGGGNGNGGRRMSISPEQAREAMARMQREGIRPPSGAASGIGGPQGQAGARLRPGTAGGSAPGSPAATAATDDAAEASTGESDVFVPGGQSGPGRMTPPSFANLWYLKDGRLEVTRVRTGISDGTNTEVSGPGIEEGMEIILGLSQPNPAGNATTNPFQQGGFGGAPGGFPGGGFGGGPRFRGP